MKKIVPLLLAALLAAGSGCVSRHAQPAVVTVPRVIEMSRAGTPTADILKTMRESGTVYRLSASQLSDLSRQGVAPEVLDYMQQTYLEAVRRDAAYDNWDRWTPYDNYWYGGPAFGWPNDRIIVVRERRPPPPPPPAKPPRGKRH